MRDFFRAKQRTSINHAKKNQSDFLNTFEEIVLPLDTKIN